MKQLESKFICYFKNPCFWVFVFENLQNQNILPLLIFKISVTNFEKYLQTFLITVKID